MCIDQGIRKIKKTSYFIISVKTILKIFILSKFKKSCNFFISTYVNGLIIAACMNCMMQITESNLQFSQCSCSSVKILGFIFILPQEKYIKVKNKANYKEHILSPSTSNCRTVSIKRTFHLDFLS